MIRKLDEELAEHERIGYRQGVAEERARIYRELTEALTAWTGGCRPDSYRVDVARHLYAELDRICPKPPGMTDLMVSPESITPAMLELKDAPPIQTADTGESFQGPTIHPCCGCSCHVCAEGHQTGLRTESCQNRVKLESDDSGFVDDVTKIQTEDFWPAELDDVFRRRRDQSAERYTREDGGPK